MRRSAYPLYFVLLALALYAAFFIVPSVTGIGYSFTDWNSYSDEISFVGGENFQRLVSPQERYVVYLFNTLIFAFVTIILKTVLGLEPDS